MNHDQLEADLRDALRSVDHVPVSGDAWQQNQRRLAASRSGRLPRLLAVAAVLVVLLVGGLLAVGNLGQHSGTPASGDGGDDPFRTEYLLGPPVQVESLTVDGEPTTHEAVLSDQTGKGPSLCDRVVGTSSASGGCTSREPDADDDGVAFDWLTGTSGSGDVRGVLAGVDERVLKVQVWMDNGDMTLADLKPSGWEGTKLFGMTVPADGPRPQRLVAFSDASGTVLQAVDIASRFGDDWLRAGTVCDAPAEELPPSALIAMDAGATDARVDSYPSGEHRRVCIPLDRVINGTAGDDVVYLVLAPEVTRVSFEPGRGMSPEARGLEASSSIWSIVHLNRNRPLEQGDEIVAYDSTGQVLARTTVGDLT